MIRGGVAKRAARAGGWKLAQRLLRPIPFVGTAVVLGTAGYTLRRKGAVRGAADIGLDVIPVLGTIFSLSPRTISNAPWTSLRQSPAPRTPQAPLCASAPGRRRPPPPTYRRPPAGPRGRMFRQAEHFSLCLRIPRDQLSDMLEEGWDFTR